MKQCRYCEQNINDQDMICPFCGYDFNTGTMSQSFDKLKAKARMEEKKVTDKTGAVRPSVKKFAFFGIGIVVLSVFYKHNFNINSVISPIFNKIVRINLAKPKVVNSHNKKANKVEKLELMNAMFFEGIKKAYRGDALVIEGIIFDPEGKSRVIIDGNVLSEGESIKGITIKKINKDSVEVVIGQETKVFTVEQKILLENKK